MLDPDGSPAMGALAVLRELVAPFAFGPAWIRRMIVDATPLARVRRMRDIVDTMYHRARDIVREKRSAMVQGDGEDDLGAAKDVMSILRKSTRAL